jgi:hypothetical protein
MQYLLDTPQSTVNVCEKIKCPFFTNQSCSSSGCARYSNSAQCHLTSVFAFESDHHSLFTTHDSNLFSVKMANDGWISKDITSQKLLNNRDKKGRIHQAISSAYQTLNSPLFQSSRENQNNLHSAKINQRFQPISLNLFNSIQFEPY